MWCAYAELLFLVLALMHCVVHDRSYYWSYIALNTALHCVTKAGLAGPASTLFHSLAVWLLALHIPLFTPAD